jgi:hypothetical protein
MGTMLYGSPPSEVPIDDRTLAHLKVVIVSKLRRNESFLLSWELPPESPEGRRSIWMHPAIPLEFAFEHRDRPELNSQWLEALARTSMGIDGLRIVPEPVIGEEPARDARPVKARAS